MLMKRSHLIMAVGGLLALTPVPAGAHAEVKSIKHTTRTLEVRIGGRRFDAKWAADGLAAMAGEKIGISGARSRPSLLHPGQRVVRVTGDNTALDGVKRLIPEEMRLFNVLHSDDW
jgi:hypothetical protein